jgi:glutathione synthase/RimK-type ligase-like ATP-grasp enzyme
VTSLVVVENPRNWPLELEGAEVVAARAYLTDERWASPRRLAVYNLCRRYGYQSTGYYVSLLAAARGHRPLPSVDTLQALGSAASVRITSDELDELIQRRLRGLRSEEFHLSIYFGRNMARKYDTLSRALFNQFPAPLLRARFRRHDAHWSLVGIRAVSTAEIPEGHRPFVLEQAARFFRRRPEIPTPEELRWDLAIVWSEEDMNAPSDERAIRRFIRAARRCGIQAHILDPDETGRIAEYDALFIRETTAVEHRTYRLALRAAREGLVVVDDPASIIRCTNKVYQSELFRRHDVPTPSTLILHEANADEAETAVGFPCVLKRPDGAFSKGTVKVEDAQALARILPALLEESELVVAQEWVPSAFDWRIGVLDEQAIYACRYHMAPGHWQIIREEAAVGRRYGQVEALSLEAVAAGVVEVAVRAASLVGSGLYGVDVKEVDGRILVMEVNDNPNLEVGYEDGVLGDELYLEVMRYFRRRLEERGRTSPR